MSNDMIYFNSICSSFTGFACGGILYFAINEIKKRKKDSNTILKPNINNFINNGAYIGGLLGLIVGYRQKPIYNLF